MSLLTLYLSIMTLKIELSSFYTVNHSESLAVRTQVMKKISQHIIISLSYLAVSWGLLLSLNFNTAPNVFTHLIAIPFLTIFTGYSAHLIFRKGL